jgi:hypothetical protein
MGREIESRLSIGRQLLKKGSHVGVIAGCWVGPEVVEVGVRRQVGRHHRQSGGRAEMAPWGPFDESVSAGIYGQNLIVVKNILMLTKELFSFIFSVLKINCDFD